VNDSKNLKVIKPVLFIVLFTLLYIGCNNEVFSQYIYRTPENINDGLEVGSLTGVRIDAQLIEKAVKKIDGGRYKEVHSMLIFKDDKLVLDEYFKGH